MLVTKFTDLINPNLSYDYKNEMINSTHVGYTKWGSELPTSSCFFILRV